MQNLDELLRKAEEIRQEVRVGGNTAQRVGLVLVQLVDTAQALLAQIQEEERLRQETDASIKQDINTLDEKVEDLPSPVAPLSNNNGLLELKYDTESLYVQDGKLCARLPEADPSEPVPGAGIIYSEGAGISIDDENVISVRIGKSLELDNNGAIRVGSGEGLIHNKEGRLCVNLGDGLGIDEYSNKIVLEDSDYIKSLPALFEGKQDVIEPGNGLEKVGNLLKVEDTLVSDVIKSKQHISSLQVEINQQSIQISSKQDKLSEGLGIIISENNEISVNGNVLSVMHANNASNDASGRSISGTYATQEEVGSVARSLTGVETKVDANAAAIEELRNNEDIIFGDGLSHVGNVVEVDSNIISGIADNAREIEGILTDVNDLQSSVSDIDTIRANATNGGKAYDWGNHGTAGYAKAVKVGDKRYEADPSATISLPAYPTSLPANGGNADTLDGHDSSYFATKTELDGKQDKLTQGSGIEITSENIINVDGSTMHVQLSTNAINDEDGNRIKTTYAKKEEIDGIYGAIEATNTTVASHTQSIGSLELNKQDKLEFGNGLSTVGNLVKVEDAVLKDVVDNKKDIDTLSSSISGKQDKLTPSDGINLDEGKLSVHIGTGLEFDPLSSAVVVKVGAGVTTDINQSLAIKHDATLTTDADGQLGVNQGTITSIAASEVAKVVANAPANFDTLKEIADYIATDAEGAAQLSNRIGAVESALPNKMDTIGFGSGLAFSSNVVKVDDAVMTDISSNKNNITKLQSSVDGLSISKQDTISDLATIRSNAANGATAYGWGYHGTAGYAKKAKVNGSTYESDSNGVINLPSYPTSLPASDVSAWAKASSKPSYSWSEINNKPDVATKEDLNNKQDTLVFGSGLTNTNGVVTVDYKTASVKWSNISEKPTFATVATSGSYNDLSNKPTIPSAVTESTVSGWGFTKNTGTYSKPSGGIPKSDLASSVQTSLSNADTAYGWGSHKTAGYAKKVKVGDKTYEADAGAVVSLPAYPTSLPANGGNADMTNGYHLSCFGHYQDSRVVVDTTNSTWYIKVKLNVVWNTNSHHLYFKPLYNNIAGQLELELPTWDDKAGYIIKTSNYNKCNISGICYINDGQNTVVYLRLAGYTEASCVIYSTCEIISASVVSDPNINFIDVKSPAIQTNYSIHATEFYGTSSTATSLFHLSSDDATLKIYPIAGLNAGVYGNEAVAIQTAFDGTDPISTDYTIIYPERTVLSLQPRGGRVGIGTTTPRYELDVNGPIGATTYFFKNNPNIYLDSTTENALVFYDGGGRRKVLHAGNLSTYFTNGFENVNGTIKISTSYITEKIKGDGLVINDSGLSVNSGVAKGQIAINISFPNPEQLINAGFLPTDYVASGMSLDDYLQAICKWAIHTYPNRGGATLIGEISPTVSGTCILNLYSNEGHDSNTKLPRYCSGQYLSLDGYLHIFSVIDYKYSRTTMPRFSDIPTSLPANGGNADTLDGHDSTYFASKTELGNKQDTLVFGSGIAHSNNTIWVDGSQLNVNFANSAGSVAWGNVSGRPSFGDGFDSTNSVVQLKLSTGLAIDDRGYLYVTGL